MHFDYCNNVFTRFTKLSSALFGFISIFLFLFLMNELATIFRGVNRRNLANS